jgi:hypothetical protein
MPDFVGYDTTQNDGDLELGVGTPCEMRHMGLREYAQRDVGSFERLPTGILRVSGGMPRGAV